MLRGYVILVVYEEFSIPKCISGMEFTVDEERKLYEMGKVVVEGG